jgi:MYXO-CTERM domain-containing protein
MFGVVAWLRIAALMMLAAVGSAWSAEVRFKPADLPDIVSAEDLWEFQYTLAGDFAQFDGLTLVFAADKFAGLSLARPPDTAAFASLLAQPQPGLGADGLLTLTAERAVISETHQFSVSFVWLASGLSGAQPFEVFDGTNFEVTQFGVTQAIPEPKAASLLLLGLVALAALRRRQPAQDART